mmetsp:Transcript_19853/g.55218  ORF Transcript_19853/g.55218 Transcript_19853/m.55218 type:complete len:109 (-) Transcript_19853:32-358(-)
MEAAAAVVAVRGIAAGSSSGRCVFWPCMHFLGLRIAILMRALEMDPQEEQQPEGGDGDRKDGPGKFLVVVLLLAAQQRGASRRQPYTTPGVCGGAETLLLARTSPAGP